MATITKYKLNGSTVSPFRDASDVALNAVFGEEVQADISIDEVVFADGAESLNSTTLRNAFNLNPIEGIDFSYTVQNQTNYLDFNFYTDYSRLKYLASNETSVGMIKDSSLNQFNTRAQGITMRLLEFKSILLNADSSPFPYVVENRKTELEKIQLLSQAFQVVRSITLEVRNLINIASDLPTLGVVFAGINLAVSLLAITALFQQLGTLFLQIQESFFPAIRYHSAIKPKTFIEKAAVNYMGYDAVEFGSYGNWERIINGLTWCPSKNEEIGLPIYSTQPFTGILKPNNTGYDLFSCKEELKATFKLRDAVIDNVYHLRPEQDPFWLSNSNYVLPDTLIETSILGGTGSYRPNFEDLNSSTIIQFLTDDSDLNTLDDLIDSEDENSTGRIISVTTVEPITVTNQRKVLLKGSKSINIPFALAVRKQTLVDELLEIFTGGNAFLSELKEKIEERLAEFASAFASGNPAMEVFISSVADRSGACTVENHFFSVPKMAIVETSALGSPRIPADFADLIGAKALYNNHHVWDSFIEGKRNPDNPNETAAKHIYEGVRIPFGLDDYMAVVNNAYFNTNSNGIGKFISLNWEIENDIATISFWVYNNWAKNIQENVQ